MPATKQYIDPTIKPTINITIFASPKPFINNIATIQINAIKSWNQLKPKPQIILCGNEKGTADIARELNIGHLPNIKCNQYGTPLLNDIFAKVSATAKNNLLTYVNSDIILTSDFLPAIQQVAGKHPRFLILGRRWNLDVNEAIDFEDSNWQEKLSDRLQQTATCSGVGALDYFVFPKPLFSQLPRFAIGRPGWDNWMVGEALKNRIPVINASLVIKPIHQNHDYNHLRGKRIEAFQGKEARENERLLRAEGRAGNSADANWYLVPITAANNPSVTVVVVGKNNRENVGQQTYGDYELVVIDDGLNKVAARNEGLARARGEFVVFLEGVSFFLPDKLAAQISCFENKAASLEMVFSGWEVVYPPRSPLLRGEADPPLPPLLRGEMEEALGEADPPLPPLLRGEMEEALGEADPP
ncbi:MAG: glycosyltransferase family A protein, partial [Cyanobacteriota bacterium]|nr:glycosyltransferase family A protein [Cyanobacteriota bacterium]